MDQVDIHDRFRQEAKGLPQAVRLVGNDGMADVAQKLLALHAPTIALDQSGARVSVLSMEEFGAAFLCSFLEGTDPPAGLFLLHTIPEAQIAAFAARHGIQLAKPQRDDVRRMLDRIAARQPQTYLSLAASAQRLLAEVLRNSKAK